MTKMKTLSVVAIAAFMMTACNPSPEQIDRWREERAAAITKTGNPDVTAEKMAVVDGCSIWKLRNGGWGPTWVFFAKCDGRSVTTRWQYQCGKLTCDEQVIGEN